MGGLQTVICGKYYFLMVDETGVNPIGLTYIIFVAYNEQQDEDI